MRKLGKRVIIGAMAVLMAVSMAGCKTKEPASEDNSDTEAEQQEENQEDEQEENQKEESEESQEDEQKEEQGEDQQEEQTIRLAVYEEAFHTAFSLEVGESRKLNVRTNYDGTLEYKSADENIATVDPEGNVTATGAGRVILTIAAGDVTRDVTVLVKGEAASGEQEEENADRTATAGNEERAASLTVEQNPTAEQAESTTKTNISISTVIINDKGESVTVVPFEQNIEINNSDQEEYHIEWQYVLD